MIRNTRTEIDLKAFGHNIRLIRERLSPDTRLMAVVKANAYGHGIERIAHYACDHGADALAVAIAEEGVKLRNAGITLPILILGTSLPEHLPQILEYDLTPAVFSVDFLHALQDAASAAGKQVRFHFKIDTGMGRIGFTDLKEFEHALLALSDCRNLIPEGIFTHFAESEIQDRTFTDRQAALFDRYIALAEGHGLHLLQHASNSGAALNYPGYAYDLVRCGICLYGYHPAGQEDTSVDLKPVLSWKTAVVHLKTIKKGDTVSYGRTFTALRDTVIATLPVGYGDGYKRALSNKASVLIHGQRAPQVGKVCMDQIMCDVTEIPNVRIGDEVILLGAQGNERITADEMAAWADTISYEILLSISDRVPRIFTE